MRIIGLFALLLLFGYVGSYSFVARNGHYQASAYGAAQHPSGEVIAAPKSAFGYDWNPFGTDIWGSEPIPEWVQPAAKFYTPLIYFDCVLIHRNKSVEKAGSGRFAVKGYYNIKTGRFSDINIP